MTPTEIITATALAWGTTPEHVLGRSRVAIHVRARQAAMWLIREYYSFSCPSIDELFGRGHGTARHNIRRHAKRMAESLGDNVRTRNLLVRISATESKP